MNLAPIVLFVYNRPWHTKQTLEALQKNTQVKASELLIYSDAAKNEHSVEKVKEVRSYIKTINGFKKITIIEREKNFGLAHSIIDGVTKIVNDYGKIIVLEDDLVTSPYFLEYMNSALNLYEYKDEVISIHGYQYPLDNTNNLPDTFFIRGADCWGWATWARGWDLFEEDSEKLLRELKEKKIEKLFNSHDGFNYTRMLKNQVKKKNDSWAVRWHASAFLENKLTLYPKISLVQNIGHDNSGTHCVKSNIFDIKYLNSGLPILEKNLIENHDARKSMNKYLKVTMNKKNSLLNVFNRFKNKFKGFYEKYN